MSESSPMGLGLYFIDVLACLLFCLTLALVGARFSREVTVPVELPQLDAGGVAGAELSAAEIVVRNGAAGSEFFYDGEPIGIDVLTARLAEAPPPSIVVRSEESAVTRVIGAAHAAGVHDIQLAYERERGGQ